MARPNYTGHGCFCCQSTGTGSPPCGWCEQPAPASLTAVFSSDCADLDGVVLDLDYDADHPFDGGCCYHGCVVTGSDTLYYLSVYGLVGDPKLQVTFYCLGLASLFGIDCTLEGAQFCNFGTLIGSSDDDPSFSCNPIALTLDFDPGSISTIFPCCFLGSTASVEIA